MPLKLKLAVDLICCCQGKQVSVLAGTGPDASRVAYVKTIKPGTENETAGLDASQDGRYEEPFFQEVVIEFYAFSHL